MNKIPFQNRIIAFVLSLLFVFSLFLSFFALPIEFILLSPPSYYGLAEKEGFGTSLPEAIAETLVFQSSLSSQLQPINLITYKDSITPILASNIPPELVESAFSQLIDQTLAFLNFRIPTSDLEIPIVEFKSYFATASPKIATEFLATLPNCQAKDLDGVVFSAIQSARDLPQCKPMGKDLQKFEGIWAAAFQDAFNGLPSSLRIGTFLPIEAERSERYFSIYSFVRWGLRLLPILTILLIIGIALLLKKQSDVMWKWCGRLLILVSAITLIGLVVLMIGFDQFVAMMLNPFLKGMISGFGSILLRAVQVVGFQMLVWVVISALVVMAFGFMLIVAARAFKPGKTDQSTDSVTIQQQFEELELEAELPEKAIIPETLEEIEEQEKFQGEGEEKGTQEG